MMIANIICVLNSGGSEAVGGVYKIGIDNQAANAYHQYQTSDIDSIMEEL